MARTSQAQASTCRGRRLTTTTAFTSGKGKEASALHGERRRGALVLATITRTAPGYGGAAVRETGYYPDSSCHELVVGWVTCRRRHVPVKLVPTCGGRRVATTKAFTPEMGTEASALRDGRRKGALASATDTQAAPGYGRTAVTIDRQHGRGGAVVAAAMWHGTAAKHFLPARERPAAWRRRHDVIPPTNPGTPLSHTINGNGYYFG